MPRRCLVVEARVVAHVLAGGKPQRAPRSTTGSVQCIVAGGGPGQGRKKGSGAKDFKS